MEKHQVEFRGYAAEFFGIWIVNLLLSLVTLGIYSAWAKVRTKQYMYGNTVIDNDPFHYLATPLRILVGRIITVVITIIWVIAQSLSPGLATFMLLLFIATLPILVVKNMRFDMRMTQFRNIRFNFVGTYKLAYWVFLGKPLLSYIAILLPMILIISGMSHWSLPWLGLLLIPCIFIINPLAMAWVIKATTDYTVNNCRYGNLAFKAQLCTKVYFIILVKTAALLLAICLALALVAGIIIVLSGISFSNVFTGDNPILVGSFVVIFYLAMFPIMLLINAYIAVQTRNYLYSNTRLDDDLQLGSNLRTSQFFMLLFTNLLLLGITWGLAHPMTKIRMAKYLAEHTFIEGDISLTQAKAVQMEQDSSLADELTDSLDLDIGLI